MFIESFAPPPRLIIFGAVDFTAALARGGKLLGFRVTVCDARAVFATPKRFPMADEVVNDWPDRYLATVADRLGPRDAICVLTHDAKFESLQFFFAPAPRSGTNTYTANSACGAFAQDFLCKGGSTLGKFSSPCIKNYITDSRSRRNGLSADHHYFPAFWNRKQLCDGCTADLPSATKHNCGETLNHK